MDYIGGWSQCEGRSSSRNSHCDDETGVDIVNIALGPKSNNLKGVGGLQRGRVVYVAESESIGARDKTRREAVIQSNSGSCICQATAGCGEGGRAQRDGAKCDRARESNDDCS